ncbi:MAG TPA: hypothetical protein VLB44_14315, partial [Kofleriaceae bacterium]|nr:hypothetical protein [Kofleriaceae bacterium]
SIPPEQLAEGGDLDLYAIRFDGVEAPIHGIPRHIKLSDAPTRDDSYTDAMRLVLTDDPDAPMPADPDQPSKAIGLIVIAFATLGIGLGLRTRVRAPTEL